MSPYGKRISYRGYTLKSTLECAWAVLFDASGLSWDYEPVKFRGRSVGVYTPDFRLNDYGLFVEVKQYDQGKMNDFELCRPPLLLVFGTPQQCVIRYKPAAACGFESFMFSSWIAAFNYAKDQGRESQ